MNKYITSSIFMVAGLGSVTAAALDTVPAMQGSDDLFSLTVSAIRDASCLNCAGLSYLGTGSSNGQAAMLAGTQTIAPMSVFMSNPLCTGAFTTKDANKNGVALTPAQVQSQACGMVIGLDDVSIYGSVYTAGKASCDGTSYCSDINAYPGNGTATCGGAVHNAGTNPTLGLAQAGKTITWTAGNSPTYGPYTPAKSATYHAYNAGSATMATWASVLRIIYFGLSDNGVQDCESDVRNGMVANWGNIFQAGADTTACNGTSFANGPTCTVLRHAWRRDSESGTTETFLSLLGAPTVTRSGTLATDDPFCNGWQKASNGTLDPNMNDYPPGYRDRDPIRRECAGSNDDAGSGQPANEPTEQICGREGKLGLVLPINAVNFLATDSAFPTALCTSKSVFGAQPPKNNAGTDTAGLCPNGDQPITGVGCLIPASASGDPNCMATKSAKPGFVSSVLKTDGLSAGAIDGRVYGLHSYFKTAGGTAGYNNDMSSTKGRPITGLFTRIHTTRSMNTVNASAGWCRYADPSTQISCLVQADECSIGFGGKAAELARPENGAHQPTASALLVRGIAPTEANIHNLSYPLWHKAYVNSAIGFNAVWGAELSLAKVAALSASSNLVSIPNPYLEDFNEQAICGASANVNGCVNSPVPGNAPTTTTCGNGVVELYEDCDSGSLNTGTCPTTPGVSTICNLACRTQLCFH